MAISLFANKQLLPDEVNLVMSLSQQTQIKFIDTKLDWTFLLKRIENCMDTGIWQFQL